MNNRYNQHRKPSRTTSFIVASVSLIAIVAIAGPWVDEYFDLMRDAEVVSDLEAEIARVRERQNALVRIETKLDSELTPFLQSNLTDDRIETVRDSLIEIVRSSKALLRQLEIVPAEPRVWMVQDDCRNETAPLYGIDSRSVLVSHSIELQADGSLDAIKAILAGIRNQNWLATTKVMNVVPTTTTQTPVSLEMRLTVFGLEPAPEQTYSDDEFEMDDVARRGPPSNLR